MKILRNFDSHNQYFDFESKKKVENKSILKINGWYKNVKNSFSALLVFDFKLYFIFDEVIYEINENCNINIDKSKSNKLRLLKLIDKDELIIQFTYQVESNYAKISPFEYLDEEDSNWGLFISNIINNAERKNGFIEIMMADV